MAAACAADPDWALSRSWDVPRSSPPFDGEDLGTYLRRIGWSDTALDYAQRGLVGASGEALRNLDARAFLENVGDTSAGTGDFRILDGYDRLLDIWARGLDIRFNTTVAEVDWRRAPVRVHTVEGDTYEADQVVVTLPLGVLQAGTVLFTPDLPPEKRAAIQALHVGPAIKLIYRFDEPVLPPGIMALYSRLNPAMWWSPSFGHDTTAHVITAFVSADRARELLALGEQAALERGMDVLGAELGRPNLQPVAARMINWVADPFALGGYSATAPGALDAHDTLARPTAGRLFWAGEATAGHLWNATVHGAHASGCRAAAEILSVSESR